MQAMNAGLNNRGSRDDEAGAGALPISWGLVCLGSVAVGSRVLMLVAYVTLWPSVGTILPF